MLGFIFYREMGNQWSSISIYIVSFQNVYASNDRILCSVYRSGWLLFFPVHQGLFHTERSLKLCSGKVEHRVPWIYGDSRFCYERVVQSCGFSSIVIAEIRDTTFHQSSSFSPCAVNPLRGSLPKRGTLCYLSWFFLFWSQYISN